MTDRAALSRAAGRTDPGFLQVSTGMPAAVFGAASTVLLAFRLNTPVAINLFTVVVIGTVGTFSGGVPDRLLIFAWLGLPIATDRFIAGL